MNTIGTDALYGREYYYVGRAGYAYELVQEQIVSGSKTSIVLVPQLLYENNPIPGAFVGNIVNIYV